MTTSVTLTDSEIEPSPLRQECLPLRHLGEIDIDFILVMVVEGVRKILETIFITSHLK